MIRKHKKTDLESILDVWYRSSTLAHPFLADDFVAKVKNDMRTLYIPDSETWVYEDDNNILGFISMVENDIVGLFVLPTHHSKGIGTQLVNFVRKPYDLLEVEVFKENRIGRAFYEKYGFVIINDFLDEASKCIVLRMRCILK